tara:strand:- start:36769 stop:37110 length:342 start_codon:yes stop_codon:yes gene_type:complete
MTTYRYRCEGMRPITDAPGYSQGACWQFARRQARQRFGKAGRVVSIAAAHWTKDGSSTTYNVSIGRAGKAGCPASDCQTVRLTVTREPVATPAYDPGPSERLWQARMAGDMSA